MIVENIVTDERSVITIGCKMKKF